MSNGNPAVVFEAVETVAEVFEGFAAPEYAGGDTRHEGDAVKDGGVPGGVLEAFVSDGM